MSVKTGSQENAGTTANVVFYAYGEDGSVVGPVLFGNGSEGLFTPGHAHKFKVELLFLSLARQIPASTAMLLALLIIIIYNCIYMSHSSITTE